MRTNALLLAIALSLASGAAHAQDAALARALSDPHVTEGVFCLWQASNYGAERAEEAAWLVEDGGALSLETWPQLGREHHAGWHGAVPRNARAILHTHPVKDAPWPSDHDLALARRLGLPVVTVTRKGIFTARPDGRVVKELSDDWFHTWAGPGRLGCEGAPVVTASVSARGGDPGSSR